ncbi:MAG: hypothetical protein WCF23_23450 [Candidatus Nitrosopolaris sp.]
MLNVSVRIGIKGVLLLKKLDSRQIKNLKTLYRYQGWHWNDETVKHSWPEGLTETFLNLYPRPTTAELKQVLYGGKLNLNSQHLFRGGVLYQTQKNQDG